MRVYFINDHHLIICISLYGKIVANSHDIRNFNKFISVLDNAE